MDELAVPGKYRVDRDRRAIATIGIRHEHAHTAPDQPDGWQLGQGGHLAHGRAGASRITGSRAILSPRLVLGTTRGAIYKTLHDARAKLRRALTDAGYAEQRND